MKKIALALSVLSFSAFAGNPELEAIFKKYESTLLNLKIGMTAESTTASRTIIISPSPEDQTPQEENSITKTILLKVEGTKAYSYELTTDKITGEVSSSVSLEDHALTVDDFSHVSNIQVRNHILSLNIRTEEIEPEGGVFKSNIDYEKDLLKPTFCDLKYKGVGEYQDSEMSYTFNMRGESRCVANTSIAEIKRLDLRAIEFCDFTQDDSECEVKDMSFLTSEL